MKRVRSVIRGGKVSDAMKATARQLAEEADIALLQPDQQRPENFYVVSHFSGRPIVGDSNAVVHKRSDKA